MNPSQTKMAPTSVGAPAISFQDVKLNYGNKTIVENISIDVKSGEFLCIVGASGCGKTTLLRMAAGLVRPTEGTIHYDGQKVTSPRREVAMVFQDYANALLPWRTVEGNVSLALEDRGFSKAERASRAKELLIKVGLANHFDAYPEQLSGGMQQRLQIARCLAQNPAVLLMDEPFGALDALTRRSLQSEVLRIAHESDVTVLFVTHDLEEAIFLGNTVIALHSNPGRIAVTHEVKLPRERDQRDTPDHPEFRRLRHELYSFFDEAH